MSKKKKIDKASKSESLLVELLTEELPPKALKSLSETFARTLATDLSQGNLLTEGSETRAYGTPRRLAVIITKVLDQAPDKPIEFIGPNVKVALDSDGNPTPALLGFAKKQGVDVSKLDRQSTPKGEAFVYRALAKGGHLMAALDLAVEDALRKLPVPKIMRWGQGDAQFVRPVHGLLMMHGANVVAGEVLGISSTNRTLGHRFMSDKPIVLKHAEDYERALCMEGKVEPDCAQRKQKIVQALAKVAGKGTDLVASDALLDEITALVEWPAVFEGTFSEAFLEVPPECLILSMRQHQKYLPLRDKETGKLLPRFLFVSNLETKDPREIIRGNERELRARLADAKFFYDQDRRERPEARLPRLAQLFSIGEQPTGEKDPFGLRRAALGVIRIIIENRLPLSLRDLVDAAFGPFKGKAQTDLQMFFIERMRSYLQERGYSANEVEAVLSLNPVAIALIPKQLEAVRAFCALPEAASLAAANKRIANILRQAETQGVTFGDTDVSAFKEPAEISLFEALQTASHSARPLFDSGDFAGYLKTFASLKSPVDSFFDKVMVMTDDKKLRENRLALLTDMRKAMNRFSDISKLAT